MRLASLTDPFFSRYLTIKAAAGFKASCNDMQKLFELQAKEWEPDMVFNRETVLKVFYNFHQC